MTVNPETVEQKKSPAQVKDVPSPLDKASDGSLTQAELAKRFGIDTSNVGRHWKKGEKEFHTWSKNRDPESISWRRCEQTGRYFKVTDEPG